MAKIIFAYQVFYMPKHLRQASKIDDMTATFAAQMIYLKRIMPIPSFAWFGHIPIEPSKYGNS
jgi:hypothetical protein